MPTIAMQRSLNHLRKTGWIAANVEKWIPPRGAMKFGVRQDVWGFGDILACRTYSKPHPTMKELEPVVICHTALIQTFPTARWKDHVEKIASIPEAKAWKAAGNHIILMAWSMMAERDAAGKLKKGKNGKAKKRWTLREEWI